MGFLLNIIDMSYCFEKITYKYNKNVYIFNLREPHWCSPNCFRLIIGQSKALTLTKLYAITRTPLCVMVLTICSKTQFRGKILQPRKLRQGIFGINCQSFVRYNRDNKRPLTLYRSQWVIAIPYFLPSFLYQILWAQPMIHSAQSIYKILSKQS